MKKVFPMQATAFFLTVLMAIAGFFLRRSQLLHELLENGTLQKGSYLHIVLMAALLVYLAILILCLRPLRKKTQWQQVFSPSVLPNATQVLCAVALAAGNVILLVRGQPSVVKPSAFATMLHAALPPLGIVGAACIAAFALLTMRGRKPSALFYMGTSLYLVVRLVLNFQEWNTDPSIHDYAFRLLSAICCMLAAYQLAGFSLDRGKRRMTLFWTLCAVVFCGITMADALLRDTVDAVLINGALGVSMLVSSIQLLNGGGRQRSALQDEGETA